MKKGDPIGRDKDGEILYFIGYSRMTYNGKPLLLCNTWKDSPPSMAGQYTEDYFKKKENQI